MNTTDRGRRSWRLAAASVLLLSGCSSLQQLVPAPLTLHDADTGGTAVLAVGQELVLRLASNRTTGFAWQTAIAPSVAVLTAVSSTFEPPTGGGIGASGTQVFTYRAAAPGQTTLLLTYVRPFDPSVVTRRFACTVRVN